MNKIPFQIINFRENELVLAPFTDISYHRAICHNVTASATSLWFFDIGVKINSDFSHLLKFPASIHRTCYSFTYAVELPSQYDINKVDFELSRDKVWTDSTFFADVTRRDNYYVATIDIDYIAFKD